MTNEITTNISEAITELARIIYLHKQDEKDTNILDTYTIKEINNTKFTITLVREKDKREFIKDITELIQEIKEKKFLKEI